MQQVSKLKVSEFFSVASQLAFQASHVIRDIMASHDLQQKMKDIDDPMTLADIKAQTLIINGLRKYWPTLKIIGEETQDFQGELNQQFLNPALYPESIFSKNRKNEQIQTEYEINDRMVVWVDPLDGTLSYVNNEFDAVTTLIGLSIDKDPVLGVIGIPYPGVKDAQGEFLFRPKAYFGHAQQQKIFYSYEDEINSNVDSVNIPFELERPLLKEKPRYSMCTSKNRLKQENLDKILSMNPEILDRIGGSGKKTLMVLEGQSDLYIYIGMKTKKWDTCPGDALIRCFGGSMIGFDGNQYSYNPKDSIDLSEPYANEFGLLATLHQGEVLERFRLQSKGFL